MGARINQTPVSNVRTNTRVDAGRQSANDSFGSRVKTGVSATAQAVATGAAVAAPALPGGAIVSAAVNGLESMASSASSGQRSTRAMTSGAYGVGGSGSTAAATTGSTASVPTSDTYAAGMNLLEAQASSNMQFITLQNQMQQESQRFTTISNVMKTRFDTSKNAINNIR